MATAMARGWAAGEGGPEAMLFCDVEAERATALAREVDGEARETLPELAGAVDALILAVKPAALDDVAAELDGDAPPLISMLAATPLARIAEAGEQRGGAAVRYDLVSRLAGELVAGAFAGAAELLRKRDPASIRNAVASPGGATEAGLAKLEGVVEDAFVAAVDASLEPFR